MTTDSRGAILATVRNALGRSANSPVPPVPGRVAQRITGTPEAELDSFLGELGKVGAKPMRMARSALRDALAALVKDEDVRKATLWETPEIKALGVEGILRELGVEIVHGHADKVAMAACDLGVTGADAGFPETGTMLLRSTPDRPRMVSLVPRIHLAIVDPAVLQADLSPALAQLKGEGYWVFVTGPSRTADIELTTTIGVHGPKALYVWALIE